MTGVELYEQKKCWFCHKVVGETDEIVRGFCCVDEVPYEAHVGCSSIGSIINGAQMRKRGIARELRNQTISCSPA